LRDRHRILCSRKRGTGTLQSLSIAHFVYCNRSSQVRAAVGEPARSTKWRHAVSPGKSQIFTSVARKSYAHISFGDTVRSNGAFMPQRESSASLSMWKAQSGPEGRGRTATNQRKLPSITVALALGIFFIGDPLSAAARSQDNRQRGQWCSYSTGGAIDCTFASFAECLDTIRGKTALCNQNPQYGQPASPHPAAVPVRRTRRPATQGLGAGSPAEQNSPAGVAGAAGPSWFEDFRDWLSRFHID
jgi:hypothetical protein